MPSFLIAPGELSYVIGCEGDVGNYVVQIMQTILQIKYVLCLQDWLFLTKYLLYIPGVPRKLSQIDCERTISLKKIKQKTSPQISLWRIIEN